MPTKQEQLRKLMHDMGNIVGALHTAHYICMRTCKNEKNELRKTEFERLSKLVKEAMGILEEEDQ